MFTVRPAAPHDATAIARVHISTWREAYRGLLPQPYLDSMDWPRLVRHWRAEITRFARPADEAAFVARLAGRTIGFATVGTDARRGGSGEGEIYMLYVLAAHRHLGVGQALLRACANQCLKRGLFSSSIWVLRENAAARRFYERLGARLVGQSEDIIGGRPAPLVGYLWDDLAELAGRTPPAITLDRR